MAGDGSGEQGGQLPAGWHAGFAHLIAGAAENRADAVFRYAGRGADFLVAASFQVEHPHNFRFGRVQPFQQAGDFLAVAQPLSLRFASIGRFEGLGNRQAAA